jgi:hypothetical protein
VETKRVLHEKQLIKPFMARLAQCDKDSDGLLTKFEFIDALASIPQSLHPLLMEFF